MAAHIGNNYAEKWNDQTTLKKLEEVFKTACKPDCYSIGEAMLSNDLYIDWWAVITKKFKDNPKVFRTIKTIESRIEQNIVNNTMDGTAKSAAFSIFLLKNKFGYKDKIERDDTVKSEVTVIDLGNGNKPDDD